jgi:hypothetical protein
VTSNALTASFGFDCLAKDIGLISRLSRFEKQQTAQGKAQDPDVESGFSKELE